MNVGSWLRTLGLEQYEAEFLNHKIDESLLPNLTTEDLKDLGVNLVGHRRRMLDAITAMDGENNRTLPDESAVDASQSTKIKATSDVDRRQLTVMFVDLVGSTELSVCMDPEDMQDIIRKYQNAVAGEVTRYGGYVAKYMGDGVLVYFGFPKAYEDAAERSVRAALSLIKVVGAVDGITGERLKTRVGIDTGLVVVGNLTGEGAAQEEVVTGETPNLAARLQALADPDMIVISNNTKELLGATFTFADFGPQILKGFDTPISAWGVTGLGSAKSRFAAHTAGTYTQYTGREEEIALVSKRWAQAKEGEGQVVTICGEPGIGKSRLLHELQLKMSDTASKVLHYQCSPYHTNVALHPFTDQLTRAAGLQSEDSVETVCNKLEALVANFEHDSTNLIPILASALSLDTGTRYPALSLSAQKQRDETLAALCQLAVGGETALPTLLVIEDVHWIDPTSQEVLNLIVSSAANRKMLVLITYRPEYKPAWASFSHIVPLMLTRLGQRQILSMIERVSGGIPLPDEVVDQIVEKTDGVPLFVEELTKTVIESGIVVRSGDSYKLVGSLADLSIPSTLKDSLLARLDRLSPVREVAQIGACIGRKFSYKLLAEVSPLQGDALVNAMSQLVDSELIFSVGVPPNATYTFKHALVQDIAYESLLRNRRRQLHHAIADKLVLAQGTEPALIASHYTKANCPELAIPNWLEAGRKALASAQYEESKTHLESGVALLGKLSSEQDSLHLDVLLQTSLGLNCVSTQGYGSPEAAVHYARAEKLLLDVQDNTVALPVLLGVGIYQWLLADFPLAIKYFQDLHDRADECNDHLMSFAARAEIGSIQYSLGNNSRATKLNTRLLEEYDPEIHGILTSTAGQDYAVLACGFCALAQSRLGLFGQAQKTADHCMTIAKAGNHPFSIAMSLALASITAIENRDFERVATLAERCIEISNEHALPFWIDYARVATGLSKAIQGDYEIGISEINSSIDNLENLGSVQSRPWLSIYLAEAMLLAGQFEPVQKMMLKHIEIIEQTGHLGCLPNTYFLMGLAKLKGGDNELDEAESSFLTSLEHGKKQENKLVELQAATALARIWQSRSKYHEALELLQPVYGSFTEGHDTQYLKDARLVLESCA